MVVFDRPTQSLLVTDLVCSVAEEPPPILAENDVRALLYHSRDGPAEQARDIARYGEIWGDMGRYATTPAMGRPSRPEIQRDIGRYGEI